MSLATHMRVSALLQMCHARGEGAYVIRKGDRTAGALLIRQNHLDGTSTLFARRYTMENEAEWQALSGETPIPDADADITIEKRGATDPDLWVVEIEARDIAALLSDL